MKTADEIKRGLEYLRTTDVAEKVERFKMGLPYAFTEEVADDAIALIQKLEAKVPRWISVMERMPDIDRRDGEYGYSEELIVYDGWRRRIAYYCHTTDVWHDSRNEDDTFEATHWMHLPEPPKE